MVQIRQAGVYAIVDVQEDIRDITNVDKIKQAITQIESPFVAINLTGIECIYSYFVKVLAMTHRRLQAAGGKLVIISPNAFVTNLLQVINLHRVIPLYNSEEEFLKEIGRPGGDAPAVP